MKFGRQLDSDHIPLQHFFIVLEHVLRHGVRPKKVKFAHLIVMIILWKKIKGTSWAEKRVVGFTAENWEAWCWSCWHYCKCSRSSNSEDSCRSSTSMAQTGSYAGQLQIYNCSDPKAEIPLIFLFFLTLPLLQASHFPKSLLGSLHSPTWWY